MIQMAAAAVVPKTFECEYVGSMKYESEWTDEQKFEMFAQMIKKSKTKTKSIFFLSSEEIRLENKKNKEIFQKCPFKDLKNSECLKKHFVYVCWGPNRDEGIFAHFLLYKKPADIFDWIQGLFRAASSLPALTGSMARSPSASVSINAAGSSSAAKVEYTAKFDGCFQGNIPVTTPDEKGFDDAILKHDEDFKAKKKLDKKAKIEGPAGSIVITTAGVRFIPKEGNGDEVTTDFIKAIKSSSVRAIEKDAKFEYFGYISQDERTNRVVSTIFKVAKNKGKEIGLAITTAFEHNRKEEEEQKKVNPFAVVDPAREAAPKSLFQKQIHRVHLHALNCIGQGQFGAVYIAQQDVPLGRGDNGSTLRSRAVKLLKNGATKEDKKLFIVEAEITLELQHPNIVRLIGVAIQQKPWLVVLEYMHFGDLRSALKSCKEKNVDIYTGECLYFAQQLACGCGFIAEKGFVHMDLACRNVLLTRNNIIKVADFGLAMRFKPSMDHVVLTENLKLPVRWVALEGFTAKYFSEKSDVWAYGVTVWEMFTCGDLPYALMKTADVPKKVYEGARLEVPSNCPQDFYDSVLFPTWIKEKRDRPGFYKLRDSVSALMDSYPSPEQRDVGMLARTEKKRSRDDQAQRLVTSNAKMKQMAADLAAAAKKVIPDNCPVCKERLKGFGMTEATALVHLRTCESNNKEGVGGAEGDGEAGTESGEKHDGTLNRTATLTPDLYGRVASASVPVLIKETLYPQVVPGKLKPGIFGNGKKDDVPKIEDLSINKFE